MLAATETEQMLAAVDPVLTHLCTATHRKRRYAEACRSMALARDCARWMCADSNAAVAALDDEPDDE